MQEFKVIKPKRQDSKLELAPIPAKNSPVMMNNFMNDMGLCLKGDKNLYLQKES